MTPVMRVKYVSSNDCTSSGGMGTPNLEDPTWKEEGKQVYLQSRIEKIIDRLSGPAAPPLVAVLLSSLEIDSL